MPKEHDAGALCLAAGLATKPSSFSLGMLDTATRAAPGGSAGGRMWVMMRKVSVVIEQDERGCYGWCPEVKGCQSQGKTVEETLANIREAIELFLETTTEDESAAALSQEIFTTAVEVHV